MWAQAYGGDEFIERGGSVECHRRVDERHVDRLEAGAIKPLLGVSNILKMIETGPTNKMNAVFAAVHQGTRPSVQAIEVPRATALRNHAPTRFQRLVDASKQLIVIGDPVEHRGTENRVERGNERQHGTVGAH